MRLSCSVAILGLIPPAFGQYAGPAILTRGDVPAAMATPQIDFRPFLQLTGLYDTGLSGVTVNSNGQLADDSSLGVEASGGISGLHSWRHTKLGLDYRASIRHYSKVTYYDGTDQSLMLGIAHQLTRHTTLSLREQAGIFTRNFGSLGLLPTVPFDPVQSYVPTTDFFDNRTLYVSTQADLTIHRSTRLSFDFGGDDFLVRRRSSALYGERGESARGDVQYRISRHSTIGVAYTFTHFGYTGIFSSTDLHGTVATFNTRITRNVELSLYGGVFRAETKFVQNVPVSPVIAALLGITTGTAVIHTIIIAPNAGARVSRTFRSGVLYITGGESILPGNGLFLTSKTTSLFGGYSFTGLRRWSFNAGAGYNRSNSIGNVTGTYGGYSGSLSASRRLVASTHLVVLANASRYQSGDFHNYNRLIYSIRVGLGFTPGDVPLRLW